MERTVLDMKNDPRRAHFEYFRGMANPYAGVTVEVDITGFYRALKAAGLPFFLSFLYAAVNAANDVPQLRQRIEDGQAVEYEYCPSSHTSLRPDGSYCYCELDCRKPFPEFIPYARARQDEALASGGIDEEDPSALLFVSCLPWLSYTALVQPTPVPADSNPRLTWGRYFERDGRTLIPVSLLVHHALADGLHIAAFYERLERRLASLEKEIQEAD